MQINLNMLKKRMNWTTTKLFQIVYVITYCIHSRRHTIQTTYLFSEVTDRQDKYLLSFKISPLLRRCWRNSNLQSFLSLLKKFQILIEKFWTNRTEVLSYKHRQIRAFFASSGKEKNVYGKFNKAKPAFFKVCTRYVTKVNIFTIQ